MANVSKHESARWVIPFGLMGSMLPQHCEFPIRGGHGGGTGGCAVVTTGGATTLATGGAGTIAAGGASTSDASVETGGTSTADASVATGGAGTGGGTAATDASAASSACGNGIIEPGEVCDDGEDNGSENRCDTGCQFICDGPCPLRVNPGATSNGSGRSWQDTKNDLQDALEQQSVQGGGQVWVLAGTFPSLTFAGNGVVNVPSHVQLLGGFAGTETSADQRSEPAQLTVVQNSLGGTAGTVLSVDGSSDVLIDRMQLSWGAPPLSITSSQRVVIRDVAVTFGPSSSRLEITGSDVRFERSSTAVTLQIADSSVAFVDSNLNGPNQIMNVTASRLMCQRVTLHDVLAADQDSEVLLIDFVSSAQSNAGANVRLPGRGALVASQVLYSGPGSAAVSGGSLLVFNSNFLNLIAAPSRGISPHTTAIDATTPEISLSTFYNDVCQVEGPCFAAVTPGDINNSLFVHPAPPLSIGQPEQIPPSSYAAGSGNDLPSNNCASYAIDSFQTISTGEVLASPHPCPDGGDAAALEASRQHLFAFAAPFLVEPFDADLSRYASPDWWQSETAVAGQPNDTGAPDPGAHFKLE